MHSLSNDKRRATRDMYLDFIRYSLSDDAIYDFVDKLNLMNDGIKTEIIDKIIELHHQDYDGKRVLVKITDKNNFFITTKLDIGVHKNLDITQDEYCFNMELMNKRARLLINSCEQIFVEKTKSLLKFGFVSTRFKDIFDFYYLINYCNMDRYKLLNCIDILIFKDDFMRENSLSDIYDRLYKILNNKVYKRNLDNVHDNWLELPVDEVINNILNYFKSLEVVII